MRVFGHIVTEADCVAVVACCVVVQAGCVLVLALLVFRCL